MRRFQFKFPWRRDKANANCEPEMTIGAPTQFERHIHVEFNPDTGEFEGIPEAWHRWMEGEFSADQINEHPREVLNALCIYQESIKRKQLPDTKFMGGSSENDLTGDLDDSGLADGYATGGSSEGLNSLSLGPSSSSHRNKGTGEAVAASAETKTSQPVESKSDAPNAGVDVSPKVNTSNAGTTSTVEENALPTVDAANQTKSNKLREGAAGAAVQTPPTQATTDVHPKTGTNKPQALSPIKNAKKGPATEPSPPLKRRTKRNRMTDEQFFDALGEFQLAKLRFQ